MHTLTDEDMIHFIGRQESQNIIKASEVQDEVLARFSGDTSVSGDLLPWSKTHNCISLRPGEVSIWGGYNGHGKSQILGQVCAWGIRSKKWLIASMEMKPAATVQRMIRQISGNSRPADEYIKKLMSWTDNRLWIYDQNDTVKSERILGMVHYAAEVLGINHIIIDSLMKCGFRGNKDVISTSQVEFVDRLCWAAKSNNIHIHLVHHMRKGQEGEHKEPGKHDFRGAGELVDLVDNAFVVHRNKRKEEKNDSDPEEPDCILGVVKQRHGEWEGKFRLWFHKDSMQYTPDSRNRAIPYRSVA